MAERSDFDDDQWFELRSAPWRVAMGVVEVDPSGGLTAGRELEAVEAALAGAQFDEGLVGLVVRDLLDQDAVTDEDVPSAGHSAAVAESAGEEEFSEHVLGQLVALNPILDGRVDPAEATAFRQWLLDLATAAAEAAREGLAGLTGPKVSDAEAAYLDRLRAVLGLN